MTKTAQAKAEAAAKREAFLDAVTRLQVASADRMYWGDHGTHGDGRLAAARDYEREMRRELVAAFDAAVAQ